jgi:DNA-directed RNA polymerase sigma subunit (sigma70/sigma32)
VRWHARRIEPLTREVPALIEAYRDVLPWATSGNGSGSAQAHSDPTANQAYARIDKLEELIERKRAQLEVSEGIVGDCLRVLDAMGRELSERHATVIETYYIDQAQTWSEVASDMGIHRDTVRSLRDSAFAWIEANSARFLLE